MFHRSNKTGENPLRSRGDVSNELSLLFKLRPRLAVAFVGELFLDEEVVHFDEEAESEHLQDFFYCDSMCAFCLEDAGNVEVVYPQVRHMFRGAH